MAKRTLEPSTASFDFDAPAPAPVQTDTRDVYTPGRLNREARMLIERGFPALWLEGEISNYSRPSSGHWYFSLKDEHAQLRCAMFRQRNLMARFNPKDGMRVLARGRLSLYEPRGEYQFLIDHIEEAGEGLLRRQFELLKAKLAAEGLFDSERKRALPKCPSRIGVITSPTGAVIRDILHVLKRRYPSIPVLLYPVPVQGADAAPRIAQTIALASTRSECDVLILARGGGSLEDLWAFNEEVVARAIAACSIPLVSAIGHEVDFTIADFVADLRAPTPSAAAEVVAPDCAERARAVDAHARRLTTALARATSRWKQQLAWLERRLNLVHPGVWLRQQTQALDELEQRGVRALRHRIAREHARVRELHAHLNRASPMLRLARSRATLERSEARLSTSIQRKVDRQRSRFTLAARQLNIVSPLATLDRGYAIITRADGHVVSSVAQVSVGEEIRTRLAEGQLTAIVKSVEPPIDEDR